MLLRYGYFVIGCFILLTTTAFASPLNASEKRAELTTVSTKIQDLQKNLDSDLTQKNTLLQQLKAKELFLSALQQQIESANRDLQAEQIELNRLQKSQEILQTQLANQRAALAEQLRMMYRLGKMQSVKTVLNPDNLNTLNRHLHYYHYLNEAHDKLILEVRQTLSILNSNLANISQHERTLKNLLHARQQQQIQEMLAQKQRADVIKQLDLQSEDKKAQLATLLANQKALQNTMESLGIPETDTPGKPFSQLYGKLEWPLKGDIGTSTVGPEDDAHHGGFIINAPEGTPVHAIYSGKVIFANWLRGFGLLVIINHGNGFMSLYARNQSLFTKVGDIVNPRDVIATIGNSGGYNKPSLYFEIRRNGVPVDARDWCHS